MISLATEFPVHPISDRAIFIAQLVSWLRGTRYSTIFDDPRDRDLEGDTAYLRSQNGEELRVRELVRDSHLEAIGFRYDFPDDWGRLWRTEAVLRRGAGLDGQDLIRLRTQCVALKAGVKLDFPRKPYLIKAFLQDDLGGRDGDLRVSDHPFLLKEDASALEFARTITIGQATHHLPVIYVSAIGVGERLIPNTMVEKIAFDLGGIAHVVVEPSRAFSFQLRDITAGANAYGGTVGVALPGRGIVRRFYLGLRLLDVEDLVAAIRQTTTAIRSEMPARGWDWTELQEQALRRQRERDRNRLSLEQIVTLYQEENDNLQDRIKQLEEQLEARPPENVREINDDPLTAFLAKKIGPEIYQGEFSDRIRLAAKECGLRSDQIGLDRRSKLVLDAIAQHLPRFPAFDELLEDLKRATKNPKRMASEVTAILLRHGYREKSTNKHIRLEPNTGYAGLEPITLPKTPSDNRGLINMRKQIEKTLGLTKLSELKDK